MCRGIVSNLSQIQNENKRNAVVSFYSPTKKLIKKLHFCSPLITCCTQNCILPTAKIHSLIMSWGLSLMLSKADCCSYLSYYLCSAACLVHLLKVKPSQQSWQKWVCEHVSSASFWRTSANYHCWQLKQLV